VDNRQCFQQSTECFQSTDDAAAFLGALASSGKLDVPYTIEAVFSEYIPIQTRVNQRKRLKGGRAGAMLHT